MFFIIGLATENVLFVDSIYVDTRYMYVLIDGSYQDEEIVLFY